jgi:hypothetical protein
MKISILLLFFLSGLMTYGACPQMRKSGYKPPQVQYTNPVVPNYSGSTQIIKDPKVYKYAVNEERFKKLSDARKYMRNLQKEAKKEGRKVEVIKVDRYTYKVISEKEAEEEYSQLVPSK